MSKNDDIHSVLIFAGTPTEAAMVKSLLENAEIQAFLKDDIFGTLEPWVTASGGVGAVKVIVSSADAERAKLVVDEYEKNSKDPAK
jgi:Putative prokaryotic signal transducing protein